MVKYWFKKSSKKGLNMVIKWSESDQKMVKKQSKNGQKWSKVGQKMVKN